MEDPATREEAGDFEEVLKENKVYGQDFYGKAQKYWSTVPATVNGMLGGMGYISAIDIQGSAQFLRYFKDMGNDTALDCGAGIGRVSKHLLMVRFASVDLVEQDPVFAERARTYCTTHNEGELNLSDKLGDVYNTGLQQFCPTPSKYNLIWCQWVLGHLTDNDLIAFLSRIRSGLKNNGYFIIKENVTSSKLVEKDDQDSSITRPLHTYEKFLARAGFRILKIMLQQNFPTGLYPVYMIACKPVVCN